MSLRGKQLNMLYLVYNLLQQYFDNFCRMLATSVYLWRTKFALQIKEIINTNNNVCFRPLSHYDIAKLLCMKLKAHACIGLHDVFKAFTFQDVNTNLTGEHIL